MRQSRYWKAGVTVFLTVAAILLFYDVLFGHRSAVLLLSRLISALEPILYGAMIAYLLAPMVDFFDRHIAPRRAAFQGGRFRAAWVRAASLAATWAVIAVFGYLLMSFLVPEVYRSILRLAGNMETYYNTILQWTTALLEQNPSLETWVMDQMNAYYADLSKLRSPPPRRAGSSAPPERRTASSAALSAGSCWTLLLSAFCASSSPQSSNSLTRRWCP